MMIGDYLWRKKKEKKKKARGAEGEHMDEMKYVGSEIKVDGESNMEQLLREELFPSTEHQRDNKHPC